MKPATHRERRPWLLVRALGQPTRHAGVEDLPQFLRAGDLLVINDAATLPASLTGVHQRTGQAIEVRLMACLSKDLSMPTEWEVLAYGAGSWRERTEARAPAPEFRVGDEFTWPSSGLRARVTRVLHPQRRGWVEFMSPHEELWRDLYRAGRPIQYSHLRDDLALWDVQTPFAGPPVSVEAPSAAFPLRWETLLALAAREVEVARLTHAAGISSTGDSTMDRELPLPERYDIPAATEEAIRRTRARGGRVIAVGTTVARALESAATPDGARGGPGVATLRLTPRRPLRLVQGILTGFHDKGASHLELLGSFLPHGELETAYREAEARGYLAHEFGDSMLILAAS